MTFIGEHLNPVGVHGKKESGSNTLSNMRLGRECVLGAFIPDQKTSIGMEGEGLG